MMVSGAAACVRGGAAGSLRLQASRGSTAQKARGLAMLCFEVYRNGQKLCTAGIGDFGILTALLTWVSHHPEKLARWTADGVPQTEATELTFKVGGLHGTGDSGSGEHSEWVESDLIVGDEVRIRIVEAPSADPPSRRYLAPT